jgi:hypothetical protein
MPYQKNFELQTDDNNVYVIGPFESSVLSASSGDDFWTPGATPTYEWPQERTGYVSRVYGVQRGGLTTSSGEGPLIEMAASPKAGGAGSLVEVVDVSVSSGPYFDSGELASGTLPFTDADYLTAEWSTTSWTGSGDTSLTIWVEVTIPAT